MYIHTQKQILGEKKYENKYEREQISGRSQDETQPVFTEQLVWQDKTQSVFTEKLVWADKTQPVFTEKLFEHEIYT